MEPSAEETRDEQMARHAQEMLACRSARIRPKPVYPVKAVITLSDGTQYTLIPNKDEHGIPQAEFEIKVPMDDEKIACSFSGTGKVYIRYEEAP